MKKLLILTLALVSLAFVIALYGCKTSDETDEFTITFVLNGVHYAETSAKFGETILIPDNPQSDDGIFKGWYLTDNYVEKWDFKDVIKDNLTLFGYFEDKDKETFNVLFYDNGKLVDCNKVLSGSLATEFIPPDRDGYKFNAWLLQDNPFDFDTIINDDYVLNADWELILYNLTFIADNGIISEQTFSVENKNINIPDIPQKEHYTGSWENYELLTEDVEINAVYTPVSYTAVFTADGSQIKTVTYTVEDIIAIPDIPEKVGYESSWTGLPITGGNVTLNALYTAITYSVYFAIEGEIVSSTNYTVENKDIVYPEIPERKGYDGKWNEVEFETGNVTIDLTYKLIPYSATFIDNSEIIAVIYFDVEKLTIQEPSLREISGYSSEWSTYNFNYENLIITAIHSPIVYTATLFIDDVTYSEIQFTVEDDTLNLPTPEQRPDYSFEWETYEIIACDIEIYGRYTPITYYVTFTDDEGTVLARVPYTIENTNISEPIPPQKDGYTVSWEEYSITNGNITVKAIYTPVTVVEPPVENDEPPIDPIDPDNPDDGDDDYNEQPDDPIEPEYPDDGDDELPDDGVDTEVPDEDDNEPPVDIVEPDIPEDDYDFNYELLEDGTYMITGYCGNSNVLIIPSVFQGAAVSTIGLLNFDNSQLSKQDIIKVEISNGVKIIGDDAFMNFSSLQEISLPESLEYIGRYAFAFSAITEIIMPDNITEFGEMIFAYSNITTVKLPDKLKELNQAFYYCTSLISVQLGQNLTAIRKYDFYGCTSLESITIPSSVKLIESEAFYGTGLTSARFENVKDWYFGDESLTNLVSIDADALTNEATAAQYLTTILTSRYWKNES